MLIEIQYKIQYTIKFVCQNVYVLCDFIRLLCSNQLKMPSFKSKTLKNKRILLFLMCLSILLNNQEDEPFIFCGWQYHKLVYQKTYLREKGSPGHKRKPFIHFTPIDLWDRIKLKEDNIMMKSLVHMTITQFEIMLEDLHPIKQPLEDIMTKITFSNKILLLFVWIVKYPNYSLLSSMFGTSCGAISKLIKFGIPLLVEHFSHYISNKLESDTTSHLSNQIVAVIDATIHPTTKPQIDQYKHWNDHYKCHGILTHLLVDFDGYIISVTTGVLGKVQDSLCANYNKNFRKIMGGKLALADPGYGGVPYIVTGLKNNQLITQARKEFDRISRSEQVIVEHVNNFIKKCNTLSKQSKFTHSKELLIGCVLICCGWYNYMKAEFNKYE